MLYIHKTGQLKLARKQVVSVYVGSAESKVMLYLHKTVYVMRPRLQVGSVYVDSAGSKVMLYILNAKQYRLTKVSGKKSVQVM